MSNANRLHASKRFPAVSCSQCGADCGPGDEGFSHCADHTKVGYSELRDLKALEQSADCDQLLPLVPDASRFGRDYLRAGWVVA